MESAFKIKTATFEGPLELLAELVEKKKLQISDISLAAVTDDFLAHLKSFGSMPLSYTANFIITAAALILIKSKSLLPNLSLTAEEEGSIDELKRRLALYRLFRDAGEGLKAIFMKQPLMKRPYPSVTPIFVPDAVLTKENLAQALRETIANAPVKEKIPETTIKKAVTIEQMIENLVGRVGEAMKVSFKEWTGHGSKPDREKKVFVIVSFLAMLELVKQGIVGAEQEQHFADIEVTSASAS